MTVLRCIAQHRVSGELQKETFKIVYVAPMKALAAEMVRSFSNRLQPLGVKVCLLFVVCCWLLAVV
jgi:activating signal cointegrator complex subunit 3